ncbi:SET domain-containing protein [Nevskia ramosa]|uniref:SET domain-containing protein n=1 Tax=Nevskia ramosa TaxID=64002 RepID=UPI002357AA0A|nr:SET domain-containing protein-lysine N-methyltransferase [Nevskia ramosa]
MFLVPTYLATSPIHGLGVFTPVAIAAGTVVWDLNPDIDWAITPTELEAFPEPFRTRIRHYSYLNVDGVYMFCGDNGKFMNHDNDPNCYEDDTRTIAARDIAAGEELSCDYRAFEHAPWVHQLK